jgi:hypothetical protein
MIEYRVDLKARLGGRGLDRRYIPSEASTMMQAKSETIKLKGHTVDHVDYDAIYMI